MKNLKKYSLLLSLMLLIPACAQSSYVTVKDTISPEFIRNQGYSTEVSRIIEVKTKDPATPLSREKESVWKTWGKGIVKVINPAWEAGYEFPSHDINYKMNTTIEDL